MGRRMGTTTGTGARRAAALALGALLAFGLVACGDDGDGDEDVVLEDIEGSETTEEATDDTGGDGNDTATTLPESDFAEGCEAFTEAFAALGTSIGASLGEVDGDAIGDFQRIIDEAPEGIREDLQVYRDAFQAYADALEEAGIDFDDPSSIDPEDSEQLAELTEIFSDPAFVDATQAIQEFVTSGCDA